jgi:hypothetical protein
VRIDVHAHFSPPGYFASLDEAGARAELTFATLPLPHVRASCREVADTALLRRFTERLAGAVFERDSQRAAGDARSASMSTLTWGSGGSPRMRSAAFSATVITGALQLPRIGTGTIEASATRRPSTP